MIVRNQRLHHAHPVTQISDERTDFACLPWDICSILAPLCHARLILCPNSPISMRSLPDDHAIGSSKPKLMECVDTLRNGSVSHNPLTEYKLWKQILISLLGIVIVLANLGIIVFVFRFRQVYRLLPELLYGQLKPQTNELPINVKSHAA